MLENIVSVFARGNQELFHSAFLAWLLKPTAAHGLGTRFLRAILERLPPQYSNGLSQDYEVKTEFRERHSRFDILVRPVNSASAPKGLVFENKVKSLGTHLQLNSYKDQGYNVALFALLAETLDEETRANYPVIEYAALRDILASLPLDRHQGYHFFILQYYEYLDDSLKPFDLFRAFISGRLKTDLFLKELTSAAGDAVFFDNDVRTFNYFYYYNLAIYLKQTATDLCFGHAGYEDGEAQQINTSRLLKNL